MTETQRVSAEVMKWQLEMVVAEEPYWDYSFPLEQMNGWNVSAVERFTVGRPLAKARDAENYVAALGQVSARMEEAIAESRRLAAKNVDSAALYSRSHHQADPKLRRSVAGPESVRNSVCGQDGDSRSNPRGAARAASRRG